MIRNLLSLALLFANIVLPAKATSTSESNEASIIDTEKVSADFANIPDPANSDSASFVYAGEFTSIWDSTNPGLSANDQVTIPTNPGYTYNYTVDWGDGATDTNVTGDITHTYTAAGRYTILISGNFPSIYFNNAGDREKIVEILSWGTVQWQTMENAFYGCTSLNFDAIDNPDLSQVQSLKNMFRGAGLFNGIINNWNVSTVTDISGMFAGAQTFNRPLDNWNTGLVTDMSETFAGARMFNEPLDNWNTALVTNMTHMFRSASAFNQNINSWTVTQVTNMASMFSGTGSFNFPLNLWNVINVTDMSNMFSSSGYNHPLDNWDVTNVTNMRGMFSRARFNHTLAGWNVGNVTNMAEMFDNNRIFNLPLNDWDVSSVTNMSDMFAGFASSLTAYNQPLDQWDVSNVTNMSGMFKSAGFNQPIEGWDVGNVTNMATMFQEATNFDQPLEGWDVTKVNNMANMFYGAIEFNQPIDGWDVSAVESMSSMFTLASKFNQPLSSWNVGNVTNMPRMFDRAIVFDQNLGSWDISKVGSMNNMLDNSALSQTNYDNTLIGWSAQTVEDDVTLGALGLQYCDGLEERQALIDNSNWVVIGDIINCDFVLCTTILSPSNGDTQVPANFNLVWEAAPSATGYRVSVRSVAGPTSTVIMNNEDVGIATSIDFINDFTPGDVVYVTVVPYNDDGPATGCVEESFTIIPKWNNSPDAFKLTFDTTLARYGPTNQVEIERNTDFTYDYSIDWGDGQYDHNVSTDIIHSYQIPGVYTIAIIGEYPAHQYRYSANEAEKLTSIDQWGTYTWKSMNQSFAECENMVYNATDIPDLSQVTDMTQMFHETLLFNGNINNWDVSNVNNMSYMFSEAEIYNQPLDNWNVSNVTNMNSMFKRAEIFDQDISSWNVGKVTDMSGMFAGSFTHETIFNQPLNSWDVSKVTTMGSMFDYNETFNQPLAAWDVGNVTNMASMFGVAESFNQPINNWNVGEVTNMARMFARAEKFNQPLVSWNVNKVENMTYMFSSATDFNQPINNWNVGAVENMSGMFLGARAFDQPLNSWNTSSVTTMESMFQYASAFNNAISNWNTSQVLSMASMFERATVFNQPIRDWDVNSVVSMASMFEDAEAFNQPLDIWDVSAVANMASMFKDAVAYDQPMSNWDVSSVTLMNSMFEGALVFNQSIIDWDVASVTRMDLMFKSATQFNESIANWDTGEVLTMREMFMGASDYDKPMANWNVSYVTTMESMFQNTSNFNQDISSWNVASVTTMRRMFNGTDLFNSPLDSWNVRKVTTMESMFENAQAFDQIINSWRVSGVANMNSMFKNAMVYDQAMDRWDLGAVSMSSMFEDANSFDEYLGDWDVSNVTNMTAMLDNTILTRENYDNTLIAWSEQTLNPGITLGAQGLLYCDALEERQSMIDTFGWSIQGDVLDCPIPACTTLTAPINGDTDVPVNTNLTWEPTLYARGYKLTVRVDPGGIPLLTDEIVTDTHYEFATEFTGSETVYVTLVPYNDTGDAIGCIEESFTIVSTSIPTIPECTNLTLPRDGDTDVPVGTDLEWLPIDNADAYYITVGTTSGANDILDNVDVGNETTYDLPNDLPEDQDIFVTITPYNEVGNAASCTEESFKTEIIPVPPACTNLTTPFADAEDVPIDTDLSWRAIDDATGYLLTVGTTGGGIEVLNNVDVGNLTTYDLPEDLRENRLIFVTITPYNEVGDAVSCTEETFRTGVDNSNIAPICTNLATPANGDINIAIDTNITWNAIGNADGYKLTVAASSSTANNETDLDIPTNNFHNFANDFEPGETVTVTIVPYNAIGDAAGCTSETFTIMSIPLCTNLTAPLNDAMDVAIDTDIAWRPIADADGYKLTVSASSSTANNEAGLDIPADNFHNFANDFEPGETVTVTIVPYNGAGDAIGCTSESFSIKPRPLCTELTNPLNGDVGVPIDTDIAWRAIADADGYKLTVNASSSTANNVNDLDIAMATSYNFPNDFEQGETVTVTIIPYNSSGLATGCTTENFTIRPVPECTNLTSPLNGDVNAAIDTNIEWGPIPDADGYTLTVITSSSTNNMTDFDIPIGTSYNFPNDFEPGENVTVTIVPYNASGDAMGCGPENFTVRSIPSCTSLTSPLNGTLDIAIDTDIEWEATTEADGYILTVMASSSTTNNVVDLDIPTGTTYDFPGDFEPGETVTVTIVPYNASGDALGCTTEDFTTLPIPACTNLTTPLNEAINVAIDTDLAWTPIAGADGYRLSVGTNPYETDLVDNEDVASLTDYTFAQNLPADTTIYVNIVPYNASGDAMGCLQDSFETEIIIPYCTSLNAPFNGETEVPLSTYISWAESDLADGYRISIGTTSSGTDIVENQDVGAVLGYQPTEELPFDTQIYVTIVPYNSEGDAVQCTAQSFTTHIPEDGTKYGFSPDGDGINEYWHIEHIEYYPENIVTIYNRWGDMVYQIKGYDNASNVFAGEANRMTKMGASTLPAGTYFFNIQVPENHILKKLQGFVVLKR